MECVQLTLVIIIPQKFTLKALRKQNGMGE